MFLHATQCGPAMGKSGLILPSDDEDGLEVAPVAAAAVKKGPQQDDLQLPSDDDSDGDAGLDWLAEQKCARVLKKAKRTTSCASSSDETLAVVLNGMRGVPDLPEWAVDMLKHLPKQVVELSDHVMEVFSPPRIVAACQALSPDLRGSFSCDLKTGWDFLLEEHQRKFLGILHLKKPAVLVLSPPCTMFSCLQDSNWSGPTNSRNQTQVKLPLFGFKL